MGLLSNQLLINLFSFRTIHTFEKKKTPQTSTLLKVIRYLADAFVELIRGKCNLGGGGHINKQKPLPV